MRETTSGRIPRQGETMKHYGVIELDVSDPAWTREYVANVTGMVESRGGRYLARTTKIEHTEGEGTQPQLFVLLEWPSKEVADEFYECEEYRPYREARRAGSRTDIYLVAGEDVNGVANIG
jgi:uncharacterized protein (DUF1330 family)